MADTTEQFSWLMLLLLSCPCPLLFIEGKTATEIANELLIPIEYVNSVLSDFGVDPEDFEDVADTPHGDYYGA